MLKGLSKLFSYQKPQELESDFELLEGPDESNAWEKYRGIKNNEKPNPERESGADNKKGGQPSDNRQESREQKDEEKSEDSGNTGEDSKSNGEKNNDRDKEQEEQLRVQDRLYAVLEYSQRDKNTEPEIQWDKKKNQEQLQAVYQGLSVNENKEGSSESPPSSSKEEDKNSAGSNKEPKIIHPISIEELVKESRHDQRKKEDSAAEEKGEKSTKKEEKVKDKKSDKKEESQKETRNKDQGDSGGHQSSKAAKNKKDDNGEKTQKKDEKRNDIKQNDKDQGKSNDDGQDSDTDKGTDKDNEANDEGETVQDLIWVDKSLKKNIKYLERVFHVPLNKDIIIRKFNIGRQIPACAVFIDGMVDKNIIVQFTLPQLMDAHPFTDFEGGCPLDYIEKNVLSIHQIERMDKFNQVITQVLSGIVAVLIDGCEECLVMESRGFEKRDVGPPVTEMVIHGSQEGFTENLRTNITLVRRIVKNENLITEFDILSRTNNYMSALLYLSDVVNPDLLNEVKRRISNLEVDYISGNGMLEQLIEDKSMMLFPQVISTERPDRVASFLMEGKVVLICEGTPFALAMPITFFDLYHTSEETNLRWQYGTFLRVIRLLGILLATFLPGVYTALTLFHQEMIPTSLLASIVVSRAAVPFPTIVEILLMEFSFELIREGGIRVPGITGNTLGIIGALILGQAAVEAGLVSPILIIIVAVSGLGSFAIPNYSLSLAVRIIRFLLILFGFIGGFYGISAGFTIICALALGMKSFGVPFFSPVAPATRSNRDKIVRGPVYDQKQKTDFLNPKNKKRMAGDSRAWVSTAKGGDTVDQGR